MVSATFNVSNIAKLLSIAGVTKENLCLNLGKLKYCSISIVQTASLNFYHMCVTPAGLMFTVASESHWVNIEIALLISICLCSGNIHTKNLCKFEV